MLSTFHKKQSTIYIVLFAILLAIIVGLLILEPPQDGEGWANIAGISLAALFFLVLAVREKQRARHTAETVVEKSERHLLQADRLIVKKTAGFLPQYWLFYANGKYLARIAVQRVPWYAYLLQLVPNLTVHLWLPLTYTIRDHDDKPIGSFRNNARMKLEVAIFDAEGQKIGIYKQNDWKTVLTFQGVLEDAQGRPLLKAKSSGFTGDFSITDEEGKQWAVFRYGWVPVEQQQLFKDYNNPYIEIDDDLSANERLMLLAMISTWFARKSTA
ncbi:hypothetical protein LOK74_22550 [Brevibacillus humidisoli]|uniref:hypothetical protein n=1 Tax=Brevibacillus humidisoli TaxID=2895522 RepID=UPI001E479D29|nr:hypothetical protein [Brevibacillus humidisoli]UFJ40738.1 hypothetical protein LOK74_22550 [Brevibacillus humidisoli]